MCRISTCRMMKRNSERIFFILAKCLSIHVAGYTRGQGSSLSPRGYGSNGSTPHSNGSGYGSAAMNGYHAPTGGLGNMGR